MAALSNRDSSAAVVRELPAADPIAQGHAPARVGAREEATLREVPEKTRRLADRLAGGSVWHTPPLSLVDARTRHHHAAGVFNGWLARWLRLAWAYLVHLPVKSAAHAIDWATESPARAAVTAALIYCAWRWG